MSNIIYADEIRPVTESKVSIKQIESDTIDTTKSIFISAENLDRNSPVTLDINGQLTSVDNNDLLNINNDLFKNFTKTKDYLSSLVLSNDNILAVYEDAGNAYFDIYDSLGNIIKEEIELCSSLFNNNVDINIYQIDNYNIIITYGDAVTTPSAEYRFVFKKYNLTDDTLSDEEVVESVNISFTIKMAKGKLLENGNICFFYSLYAYAGPGYQTVVYYAITDQDGTVVQAQTQFKDLGQTDTIEALDFVGLTTNNIFVVHGQYGSGFAGRIYYKIISESNSQIKAETQISALHTTGGFMHDISSILLNSGNVLVTFQDFSTNKLSSITFNSVGTIDVSLTVISSWHTMDMSNAGGLDVDVMYFKENILFIFNCYGNCNIILFDENLNQKSDLIDINEIDTTKIRININDNYIMSLVYNDDTLTIFNPKDAVSYLGLIKDDVTTGNKAELIFPNQIAEGFSNLKIGQRYYIDLDGNISENIYNEDKPIGIAIDKHKLLTKRI